MIVESTEYQMYKLCFREEFKVFLEIFKNRVEVKYGYEPRVLEKLWIKEM
jgi:hypothetical protein